MTKKPQIDKFREAARELEGDESVENFERTLKAIAGGANMSGDFTKLSNKALTMLHDGCKNAVAKDDMSIANGVAAEYGVYEYDDWKPHIGALEDALKAKDIEFEAIDLSKPPK